MNTKTAFLRSRIALISAVCVLCGCSTSFNRSYKSALSQPIPSDSIAGPWEGRWLSDKNGHTGKLRAVLRASGPQEVDAYFHATFWKIFSASYRVPLKMDRGDKSTTLQGQSDLGWLSGGVYTYEGEATPSSFFSTYKSKYDFGTFEMKRPPEPQKSIREPAASP